MAETRRKFDQDFKEGAVRLVRETGKPIAQVARDLGIVPGDAGELGGQGPPAARGRRWPAERGRAGRAGPAAPGERRACDEVRRAQAQHGPLGSGRDGQQVAVAAFIAAQRADHGIPAAACCRALGVPRSWYYKWKDGDRSPRRARRERLKAEIARLFAGHKGKRGSPMIAADLRDAGWRVSKNTVAALMAEMGLAARPKSRRRGTTRPGKGRWKAPDLVKRDFPAARDQRQVVRRRHRYRHR